MIPKTLREIYKLGIIEQAVINDDEHKDIDIYDALCSLWDRYGEHWILSKGHVVINMFTWRDTPQGHAYWADIDEATKEKLIRIDQIFDSWGMP